MKELILLEALKRIVNSQPRTNKKGWIDPLDVRGLLLTAKNAIKEYEKSN